MPEALRIGVLGLTHDHVWGNLDELAAADGGVLVAAADPHQPLLDRVRQEHDCTVYTDYEALLDTEDLDAVYVYSDNAAAVKLVEMAAAGKLHAMVEKPMAANLEGADRMLAAVRNGGVRLMINWPFAWWPQLQRAISLAGDGDIGDLWEVKYRAAHSGPREEGCSDFFCDWLYDPDRNGAGALIDYCCYGALLARAILGVPSRVFGVAGRLCKEDITVDDNALIVMAYPRAMALSEASWTQVGSLSAYLTVIHGTRGTLLVEPRRGGRLLRATGEEPAGVEVEVPASPAHMQDASHHFLHCLAAGEDFTTLCADRIGRDTQEILEAGLLCVGDGAEVSLPLREA